MSGSQERREWSATATPLTGEWQSVSCRARVPTGGHAMSGQIRVLVVDDHDFYREGIKALGDSS